MILLRSYRNHFKAYIYSFNGSLLLKQNTMENNSDSSDKTTNLADCNEIYSDKNCEQCCFYCNEKDVEKLKACGICQTVYYCSKDHQNIHLASR